MKLAYTALPLVAWLCSSAFGQTIQITSPAPGTQFSVGSSMQVNLNLTNPSAITEVWVGLKDVALVPALIAGSTSTQIQIQSDALGALTLSAAAVLTNGQVLLSNLVDLEIMPGQPLTGVSISPRSMSFDFQGEQNSFLVSAKQGSRTVTLARSSLVSFSIADPTIASVSSTGTVTALQPGSTHIHVTVAGSTTDISVTVPNRQPGDLNGDGIINQDDLDLLSSFVNTPASTAGDARDINHDGRIDSSDVTLLAASCTIACKVSSSFPAEDLNLDGHVDCTDLQIVRVLIGKRTGDPLYDPHADIDANGIINVLDLAKIARALPVGLNCSQ